MGFNDIMYWNEFRDVYFITVSAHKPYDINHSTTSIMVVAYLFTVPSKSTGWNQTPTGSVESAQQILGQLVNYPSLGKHFIRALAQLKVCYVIIDSKSYWTRKMADVEVPTDLKGRFGVHCRAVNTWYLVPRNLVNSNWQGCYAASLFVPVSWEIKLGGHGFDSPNLHAWKETWFEDWYYIYFWIIFFLPQSCTVNLSTVGNELCFPGVLTV